MRSDFAKIAVSVHRYPNTDNGMARDVPPVKGRQPYVQTNLAPQHCELPTIVTGGKRQRLYLKGIFLYVQLMCDVYSFLHPASGALDSWQLIQSF